jgi:hypothetical protein
MMGEYNKKQDTQTVQKSAFNLLFEGAVAGSGGDSCAKKTINKSETQLNM